MYDVKCYNFPVSKIQVVIVFIILQIYNGMEDHQRLDQQDASLKIEVGF